MNDAAGHRFGFVACAGRANVGKSTLINRLIGEKLAIVSRKPQTTRRRLRGLLNLPGAQIVLVDTPGLHDVDRPVNRGLERETREAVHGADAVLALTDPRGRESEEESRLFEIVRQSRLPAVLAINKADLVPAGERAALASRNVPQGLFKEILSVSARTGENVEALPTALVALLPEGPPAFSRDIVSDQPERDFFSEIVREKLFRTLHQEMPYAVAVVIDEVSEENARGLYRVRATLYVERDSQKGILIGRGGSGLKRIGEAARRDMERLTGSQVHLALWVKVRKNWTRDERALREFGFL